MYPIVLFTFRLRQNGCHFADDILKYIFFNESMWISIKILLKFVPGGSIKHIPALLYMLAWRRTGGKPLSEPVMVYFDDAYMGHFVWMN